MSGREAGIMESMADDALKDLEDELISATQSPPILPSAQIRSWTRRHASIAVPVRVPKPFACDQHSFANPERASPSADWHSPMAVSLKLNGSSYELPVQAYGIASIQESQTGTASSRHLSRSSPLSKPRAWQAQIMEYCDIRRSTECSQVFISSKMCGPDWPRMASHSCGKASKHGPTGEAVG